MSESQDKQNKTEQATDKRQMDAREEGNVPYSREVANFSFLIASMFLLAATSAVGVQRLTEPLAALLGGIADLRVDSDGDVIGIIGGLAKAVFMIVLPVTLIVMVAGVGSSILQNPPNLAWKRIKPDVSRLSPLKGLQRMFGSSGLIEFAKTAVRFWCTAAIGLWVMFVYWDELVVSLSVGTQAILPLWHKVMLTLIGSLLCLSTAIMIFDWPLAHIIWQKQLRMSRQDIKDEQKQAEGDAQLIARRRSIARARLRRRLKRDVAKATVVIANPTHYAVALRYVRQEGGAPRVVAKGQDMIALAIRREAEDRGIPVVEDKALARSLYSKVQVDQVIPVEFYRVIAEVIVRLQKRPKQNVARAF